MKKMKIQKLHKKYYHKQGKWKQTIKNNNNKIDKMIIVF